MLSAATSHAETDTTRDDEGVADHRGDQADRRARPAPAWRRPQQIAAARPGRHHHRDARDPHQQREHAVGTLATSTRRNMPQRRRPAHRRASSCRPARGPRRRRGKGDSGTGQHQAELEIEPGRGDLGADRARGRLQEFERKSFRSMSIVEISVQRPQHGDCEPTRQIPIIAAPGHRYSTTARRIKSPKIGHIAAIRRNGLAGKCGDDKDASCNAISASDLRPSWPLSTRSASPSCSAPSWSWPASCRACWRCASARRCCWCSCSIGMLAGDAGPGQLQFDDVRTTYLVGSVALALILFDGGLRTRFQSIRAVLAPSMVLATVGVLLTALITAPVAKYALDLNWTEALLVGAVVASTDAAAVFLLVHAQGLRLRPRVGATLEAESGSNDPFAVFLTLMLVEFISVGHSSPAHVADGVRARGGAGRRHRRDRRAPRGDRAQPGGAAAGPACAVRHHRGAGDLRRRADRACLRLPRGLSRRHHHRQPADARA